MCKPTTIRLSCVPLAGLLLLALVPAAQGQLRHGQQNMMHRVQQAAPVVRQPPVLPHPEGEQPARMGRRDVPAPAGQQRRIPDNGHLGQWMNQHKGMTPAQQQQALQREPGFRELPPQTQQRYIERLAQLNAMPAGERQKMLVRNEWMEHLNPDQRAQVRGATEELGSLPPEQRKAVARSFRQLRELPPGERNAAMNSQRFGGSMNPAQMDALRNLMRVEPMMPPPEGRLALGRP
jgi:hypothetical protein